jgi:hypothetical protein
MSGKDPLYPDPVGDLANGEGGSDSPALLTNHHAFEGLDTLLVSFDDLDMDLYRVADPEVRKIGSQLFQFNPL